MSQAGEWHGLWHRRPLTRWNLAVVRALVYLGVPLILALLFVGERDLVPGFLDQVPTTFVVTVCAAGCFELLYSWLWPHLVRRPPGWGLRIAGHLATIAVTVAVSSLVAALLLDWLWGYSCSALVVQLRVQIGGVSVVMIGTLVTLDEMAARARGLERRADQARVAALRAELAALQARTDPHFLFNCLNTVAALINDDPPLAEAMLERLAAVFRYALDAGRRAQVTLADELAALTAYLEVEAMRLGVRLRWRLDCDDAVDPDRVRLPPLVLQPLAENAILHGAGRRRGATRLSVTVDRRGHDLVLAVEDQPADEETGSREPIREPGQSSGRTGTALSDLAARLALAYGGRARLVAAAAAPAGWRAELVLPAEPP
jgi:two-component system, LytTR family, sensor histidine kinase AlgZ